MNGKAYTYDKEKKFAIFALGAYIIAILTNLTNLFRFDDFFYNLIILFESPSVALIVLTLFYAFNYSKLSASKYKKLINWILVAIITALIIWGIIDTSLWLSYCKREWHWVHYFGESKGSMTLSELGSELWGCRIELYSYYLTFIVLVVALIAGHILNSFKLAKVLSLVLMGLAFVGIICYFILLFQDDWTVHVIFRLITLFAIISSSYSVRIRAELIKRDDEQKMQMKKEELNNSFEAKFLRELDKEVE